jgi:hypothetical protein
VLACGIFGNISDSAIRYTVANNRAAAELMGIPSTRILALSFGLGTMLAAVSGALIATFFPFSILAGGSYELKSFVIGVLGGLGNPIGALFGGLMLGVLEGIIPAFMETSWVPVIEFGLFVLILLSQLKDFLGLRIAMPEINSQLAPVVLVGRVTNGSEDVERARILQALEEAKGQISGPDGAAARLGLKRTTLQSRMQKYKIARQYQ